MTVSTTTSKVSYSGNGSTTVFAYTFKVFDEDDLTVILRDNTTGTETVQTITTNYTVSGVGNANGGNVTFGTAPASGKTIVVRRESDQTQTTDYTPNDPFPAEAHEDALDKLTFIAQEVQEELDRAIKISRTNTMTSTEFAVGATARANKILAFDSSGEIAVTQEIGTFIGNWSASTTYNERDIVKDTSTNNIFIANTTHTSSGSQPLTTNTDSAKWDLLVDAASATTSATAAASSATAAATSATASATSATASASSASASSTSATNAATSETNAATSATNAATSATASAASAAAADATFDLFDDAYLGAKASNPSVDNDGNALQDGALYFDTTNNVMKVYDLGSTTWLQLTPTVSNQTNINTVAGISSDVTAVAGNSTNINAVAADATDIGTVATNIANVNSVGGSIANVNTVATNLTDINSFANTYFISATAPSSPTEGDLWFDTANDIMKVYDGSGFVNAGSSVNGTANRVVYTATAGQTTFSATYDAGYVDVYLNGVKLIAGTDFTATNGSSVVLATGAALNDTVDIVAYGTFNVAVIDIVNDTTPQLGGNLDVQTHSIVSTSNRDINITPNGTGNVSLGNFTFDADQSVGVGQDNYLLTYDHSTTSISLEAAPAGGAGYFQGENGATGDTTNGKGDIFRVHEQQLDTNTTIAAGDNAGAFFSLTVATGVTLTVNGNLVIA